MFQSARITLTLFYLAILVALSLIITFSIRILAEREYINSNMEQRGQVRQIILNIPGFGHWTNTNNAFIDLQEAQEARVRAELNHDMLLINSVALIVSGVLSYWFAGRTLKPIEEAHEAQARFASDASHELRTPLTNLKLENEVFLRQKNFSQADARELIASNLEEVQRLEGLSSNLLALTQYGSTPLTLEPVSIRQVASAAVKVAKVQAEVRHITITTDISPVLVRGHHDSLVQLMGILLDNAIKYSGEVKQLSAETNRSWKSIVDDAVECPATARAGFLHDRCENDPELQAAVESLLASDPVPHAPNGQFVTRQARLLPERRSEVSQQHSGMATFAQAPQQVEDLPLAATHLAAGVDVQNVQLPV